MVVSSEVWRPADGRISACCLRLDGLLRQRPAGLFGDDVFGVPVRPVFIVLAAGALLVLAMGAGGAAKRGRKIGLRGKRGLVRIDAAGQARGDLLEQPAIAVGIAERGVGTVAAALGIRPLHASTSGDVGLVLAGMLAVGMKDLADID